MTDPDLDAAEASAAQLEQQLAAIQLPRFGHAEALALGNRLLDRAVRESLPITMRVTLGDQVVFHAALAGTSADNDTWIAIKTRVVRRFDTASLAMKRRLDEAGLGTGDLPHIDPREHVMAGGGVPIRVHGTTVGVLAVSGLADHDDHRIAIDALRSCAADGAHDTEVHP